LNARAQRTQELRITQHLHARALHDPDVATVARRADRELLARTATAVRNGKLCGEVADEVDPDVAAARILAAIYGQSSRMLLTGQRSRARTPVVAILDPVLATVFTGRCQHYQTRA
jgi:hypothetical protein